MMAEREHYPSPDLSWASAGAPPYGQPHPLQAPRTFQASRDWSWVQPAPTAPAWPPHSTLSCTGAGYPQLYSGSTYPAYQYERRSYGQNQWRKKNKQKETEFSHFCDTCDRVFKDQSKYQEHMGQHVKCSVEDCKFTAHEKIVKIHWMNNHAPGKKRIKLDTPEEITKWREERRRNYPTLTNVEKKVKLMEVKEKRGDVLETAQFGRFKRRGGGGHHRGRGFQNHRGRRSNCNQGPLQKEQPQSITQVSQDGDPLGALVHSDPDSEESSRKETCVTLSVAPKSMTSALGSLISSYGDSMTESEGEGEQEPDASPVLKAAVALEENKVLLAPSSNSVQNSLQRSHLNSGVPPPAPAQHKNQPGGRTVGPGRRNPRSRCGTLLEMLLAADIRHERNVLLQCVRFIIYSGFFGLEPSDSTAGPTLGEPHGNESETRVVKGTSSDVVPGRLVCQLREGSRSNVDTVCNKMDTTVLKQKEVLRCAAVPGATGDAQTEIQQLEENLIKTQDSSQLGVQISKSSHIPAVPQDLSSGETLLPKNEMHVSSPGSHKETCAGLMVGSTELSGERTEQEAPVLQDLSHQPANDYDDIIWEDSGAFSNTV